MGNYVELHCHSDFSFREGASSPLELVLTARELGYPALALTDHDGLAGAMKFARTAKEWGMQPIIGAELTLRNGIIAKADSPESRKGVSAKQTSRTGGAQIPVFAKQNAHLTLLAETARGYANLSRLLSEAHLSSPRGEPALDPEALAGRTEGLIALSGCRDGEVPRLLAGSDFEGARWAAHRYIELFGPEGFWIELQDNLVYGDRQRNRRLVALAGELRIGIVATNNAHYHTRSRHRLQDVMIAIRHRTTLDACERQRRKNSEFYLKSPEEMRSLFADLPEAINNTLVIAERCRGFDLTQDLTYVFPDYEAPDGKTPDEFLEEVCLAAARELYR